LKLTNFIKSILILSILTLFCAVRHFAPPVYAGNRGSSESEDLISGGLTTSYTLVIPDWSKGTDFDHRDFIEFALSLNEVKHGESEGNAVQRMREDRLEIPKFWFCQEGWQELSIEQKRTLLAGSMTFLNLYMKENEYFNDREKSLYDQFSARITVEEIVNHVESMYQRPQYQDDSVENLIFDFLLYNFFDYMGQTISYPG